MIRYRCKVCGKLTAGRIPKLGDGTFAYPRWHKHGDVRCMGNYEEADWVEVPDGKRKQK